MQTSIEIVYYIFNKILDILFNKMIIVPGVSLGWILIAVLVILLLINSILNLPQLAPKDMHKEMKGGNYEHRR